MIHICVPFSRKDEAKGLGARWDPNMRLWYAPSDNFSELLEKFKRFYKIDLPFEDRTFGGNNLFVDLVPRSCWFTNVRYCVSLEDWERLRHTIYYRVGHVCEACGKFNKGNLEAHERWSYDNDAKVQKLERLVALCKECHTATHMGLAKVRGLEAGATAHLKLVTGMDDAQVQRHIQDAYDLWRLRSQVEWHLDLGVLTNSGVKVVKPVERSSRSRIVETNLCKEKELCLISDN